MSQVKLGSSEFNSIIRDRIKEIYNQQHLIQSCTKWAKKNKYIIYDEKTMQTVGLTDDKDQNYEFCDLKIYDAKRWDKDEAEYIAENLVNKIGVHPKAGTMAEFKSDFLKWAYSAITGLNTML